MKPWEADIELTDTQAKQLITTQFPELAPVTVSLLGVGWDNWAFQVNDRYIFRFPRREIAVALLNMESQLLPFVAARVSLAIPEPCFIGEAQGDYPWPFAGYPEISGYTACQRYLNSEQRTNLARPLAIFLRELHHIDVAEAKAHGAAADQFDRLGLELRVPKIKQRLHSIFAYGILQNEDRWMEYLNQCVKLNKDHQCCLTHGDLYARHLLLDDHDDLNGVIDWGDMSLCHPALDLSVVHSFLPPHAHEVFLQHYGSVTEETWELARFRALYSLVTMATYSHDVNDKHLLAESYAGLDLIYQGFQS